MAALLSLSNIVQRRDDRVLLRGISLVIEEGERVALLGANGCGKSTLLRILAGTEAPDEGTRSMRRDLRLGFLEQEPELPAEQSARDAVRGGMEERAKVLHELVRVHAALESTPEHAAREMEKLVTRAAALETRLESLGGHDVEHKIERLLQDVGLADPERRCGAMSGGERRRVALARLFASSPELLLLDEPTNHLDAIVTDWLEDLLLQSGIPFVLVTHDRYFLDRTVDRIIELDRGDLISYQGGYGDYLVQRAERAATEEKNEASRQNLLRRETIWMRRGAPARTTKQKARIQRFEGLVDDAPLARVGELEFELPPPPRLGTKVIELEQASVSIGGRVIVPPIRLSLGRGERLGVVGPNGAGKTTLLRLLHGTLAPSSGTIERGETVRFAFLDQSRASLDPAKTVIEEVAGQGGEQVAIGERIVRAEGFLERFLFPGALKYARVATLSGGEKNRLMLAKLLLQGGNVLLLDEPTNDLDLASLRILEEALLAFEGTLVIVSHDRWFLDRVATRILFLDGEGGARTHAGDLSQLLDELRARRDAARSAKPLTRETNATEVKPAESTKTARKRSLSSWEQRELDQLMTRIADVEREQATLDARLADPAFYASPRAEQELVQRARAASDEQLLELLGRWEELEGKS